MSHRLFCFRNWSSVKRILLVQREVQDHAPHRKDYAR